MNRWIRWARQLRARHGRTELRRGSAAMVLARRPGATLLRIAGTPIHVNLYPRLGVTLAAVTPPPLALMGQARVTPARTQVAPALVERTHVQPMRWSRPARETVMQWQPQVPAGAVPADAARMPDGPRLALARRFVTAPVRRAVKPESQTQNICRLARMWTGPPAAAQAAVELSGWLRLRGRRTEVAAPAVRELVAAAPRRRETTASVEAADSMAPARAGFQQFAQAATPAAIAAINVEALTSQVIQQLDRRLIAYRERLGRG